jgi:hypothetical protein
METTARLAAMAAWSIRATDRINRMGATTATMARLAAMAAWTTDRMAAVMETTGRLAVMAASNIQIVRA